IHNLATIHSLPFNVYFLNTDSYISSVNELYANTMGFVSVSAAKKGSIRDVATRASAALIIERSQEVLRANRIKIYEEDMLRKDDISVQRLVIKSPLYNEANKIIGLFGCNVVF